MRLWECGCGCGYVSKTMGVWVCECMSEAGEVLVCG